MHRNPKTPAQRSRARSEAKTPLTPALVNALNNVSITSSSRVAGSKSTRTASKPAAADLSNPFITASTAAAIANLNSRSRPSSPIKRSTTSGGIAPSESLQRQAGAGVIRKGGVESRLEVVTRDYVPPPKPELKRSKSTPATNRTAMDQRDHFITNRETSKTGVSATLDPISLNPKSASPGHTARLASAAGVPLNRRVLGYHEPPPSASSSDTTLAQQREYAKPLYAQRPGALPNSTGSTTNKSRKIATQPERVLDAPGMVDDFYLNLLSWSCQNAVAVALEAATYIWKADTGTVVPMGEAPEGTYVSSVDFSNDGMFLGVGIGNGDVELGLDLLSDARIRIRNDHKIGDEANTQTSIPISRAASASGAVLIPTTSAPEFLNSLPSAGVSYVGPDTQAYVPSASSENGIPSLWAAR